MNLGRARGEMRCVNEGRARRSLIKDVYSFLADRASNPGIRISIMVCGIVWIAFA